MPQAAGYHGISNAKYAIRSTEESTIQTIPYAKSISLNAMLQNAEQYANNRMILQKPKDDGYEGSFGTTASDQDLEKSLGYLVEGESGMITTAIVSYKRLDFYYEIQVETESGTEAWKIWLFNIQVGKGNETNNTDTNSIEYGTYEYPIRVYGDKLMNAEGTAPYVDEKGVECVALRMISKPGDTDYATFGSVVPKPKVKAVA